MAHTQIMEPADATADLDPGENGQRTLGETLCQRSNCVEALGDDIAGVGHAIVLVAGSQRRRHGQSRAMQPVSQLPFRKRPRLLLTAPEVLVTREVCDEAPPVVVPQDK